MSERFSDRGLSPVIGATLLVVIAVLFSSVVTVVVFGVSDRTEPAPEVAFTVEETDRPAEYRIVHESGKQLVGDRVTVRGVASESVITDDRFAAGESETVFPTENRVRVVWYSETGESYVLEEFEPDTTIPDPDVGCPWVQSKTNGGTDSITVPSGTVVNCDIVTDGDIDVEDGAIVVGTTDSRMNSVDIDGGTVYGPVDADGPVDLDNDAKVYGPITAGGDVNSANSLIDGSVETTGGNKIDIDGGTVDGNLVSSGDLDVDSGVTVKGAVVSDGGSINVYTATVDGHAYGAVNTCTGTVNGHPCSSYTSKSYGDWSG